MNKTEKDLAKFVSALTNKANSLYVNSEYTGGIQREQLYLRSRILCDLAEVIEEVIKDDN